MGVLGTLAHMAGRGALAVVILAVCLPVTACSGSDSKEAPSTSPTMYNGKSQPIRTTVCDHLISEGVVPMTSLVRPGGPVRLHDQSYDRRVFVFAEECGSAPRVSIRPASCESIELMAPAEDGRPVAMLVDEFCSFKVWTGHQVAAVVTVHS